MDKMETSLRIPSVLQARENKEPEQSSQSGTTVWYLNPYEAYSDRSERAA